MYIVYAVLAGIGAVLFVVGMLIVGDKTLYKDQTAPMNIAIVGAVLANAAGILLLMAGRRAVVARRVSVLGGVPKVEGSGPVVTAPASSLVLVGGEGLTHYHRLDCVMAAARDWPALDRAEHERAGRTACGVCTP